MKRDLEFLGDDKKNVCEVRHFFVSVPL